MKTEFITYMKNAGALVRPKDVTRYSYRPYLVEKVVFGILLILATHTKESKEIIRKFTDIGEHFT